jgi:hypothetical protein
MQVTAQSFALRGDFMLKYPWVPYVKTNIGFTNKNGLLEFGMYATEPIKFTKNKLKTDLKITEFSHQLLLAEGTVEEPGAFPETNVILTHNPQKVQIDIKEDETIRVSDANYFDEVIGEMHIDKNLDEWSIFWFEGYPRGMNGVSDNDPEKLTFTVNGVVTATDQEIGVKKVPTSFGGLSFVYDLPKSELKGNCTIDMDVAGLGVNGGVEAVVGNSGWYFQATGSATVPNYGAMSLFALFGDYNGNIDMLKCGGFECLPIQFQNKVKGFLISGSITKQFVNVGYGLPTSEPLLEVAFGVDVSLAARFFTSFEDVRTEIGLSVKLYGDAFANATLPGLIASANSRALIGLAATYNTSTHYFTVNGQTGLSLSTSLKQWNPPPVGEIELGPFDVGVCAMISGDSNGGFEYDLKIEKCDECN